MDKIDLAKWRFDNLPEYAIAVPFDELRALVDAARRGKFAHDDRCPGGCVDCATFGRFKG